MAINIGPIITNAHAAQNLSHLAVMRNLRAAQAGYHGQEVDAKPESGNNVALAPQRPWRALLSGVVSLLIGVLLVSYSFALKDEIAALPNYYTPQTEVAKKEYYPAYLVNKRSRETCDKYGKNCVKSYTFVIKMDNSQYAKVPVSEQSYFAHNPGTTVHLERHISDPKQHVLVREHEQKYMVVHAMIFGSFLCFFGVLCISWLVFRYWVIGDP